jgi:hypothetical protein
MNKSGIKEWSLENNPAFPYWIYEERYSVPGPNVLKQFAESQRMSRIIMGGVKLFVDDQIERTASKTWH